MFHVKQAAGVDRALDEYRLEDAPGSFVMFHVKQRDQPTTGE